MMLILLKKHPYSLTLALLAVCFVLCLCFGAVFISPIGLFTEYSTYKPIIILRIYRLCTGFIVGGALAVAGVGCQAVLKNSLADPFILGISGGASLGIAIAIVSGLAVTGIFFLPLFAFVGAIITLGLVVLLSYGTGIEYSNNILLSGVIIGTICSSFLMFIITTLGIAELNSITWWMFGNLQPGNRLLFFIIVAIVIIGTITLFLYGKEANAISVGDDMAYFLGHSPFKIILIILGVSSFMTAAVVSISGIIGFVGLIVPHILRRCFGADHRILFPMAFFFGGIFLMICDTIAKTVLSPEQIPVGVITALIGGPFFLWILRKKA